MIAIIQFPRQRPSLDAGRRAPCPPSVERGTFSSWQGVPCDEAARTCPAFTGWLGNTRNWRTACVAYENNERGARSAAPRLANLSTAHHAPFARARNTSEIVASPDLLNHRIARESGRATYINRRHLLTAICVSWTIAVGVALVWSMT